MHIVSISKKFLHILYNTAFIEYFLSFLYQVMRKLQKFLQRQRGMAEKQNVSKMSAKQRAQQSGNENFYADGEILFCRACSKAVDHSHQSSEVALSVAKSQKNLSKSILPK